MFGKSRIIFVTYTQNIEKMTCKMVSVVCTLTDFQFIWPSSKICLHFKTLSSRRRVLNVCLRLPRGRTVTRYLSVRLSRTSIAQWIQKVNITSNKKKTIHFATCVIIILFLTFMFFFQCLCCCLFAMHLAPARVTSLVGSAPISNVFFLTHFQYLLAIQES